MFTRSTRIRLAIAALALLAISASPNAAAAAEADGWGACGYRDCNVNQEGLQRNQCYFEGGVAITCECQC
jgi:hypothetical protein